jgi:hypothetical protein
MLAIKTKQPLLVINLGEDNNYITEQNKDTRFGPASSGSNFLNVIIKILVSSQKSNGPC